MIVFDNVPSRDKNGEPMTAQKVLEMCLESDRRLKAGNLTDSQRNYKPSEKRDVLISGERHAD